ncbi:MAG: citrate synthase [Candidatus Dadabacteria bacterium]|nr:MAG: citrate synthase [Candidatus Dadabacteria bacterium]
MGETAELKLPGKSISLPIVEGSEGEKAIDIARLRSETGYITLDPGFVNTGSCTSEITFIDGEKGILRYRGIPIEQLAEKSSFLEVSYLLINGKLPTASELEEFTEDIRRHTMLHEDVKRFYDGFPRDAHPMAILASVVSSLSAFYQDEVGTPEEVSYLNSIRLLAKLPTIVAWAYKKSVGQPFMYPDNNRDYCENFLYMMFGLPAERYEVDPVYVEVLDKLLILHADHEQNCSTSTVRVVRSSMSNMFACITAGICALWGHRHGGANQRVIEMLEQIRNDGCNVEKYVELAKKKDSGFRLMGFGHRVYKNFDPRARIIKEACDRLLNKLHISDPLLEIAQKLERAALEDDYFKERKLYPNVDFYSGIIYKAMGIPVPAFTVMFALGRLPGWIAQAKEYTEDPKNKISRPRQIYTGPTAVDYTPIEERS